MNDFTELFAKSKAFIDNARSNLTGMHYRVLMTIEDPEERSFYEDCYYQAW